MRVYKKSGTKERLFEMFENVNKVKLNESQMWGENVNNESFDSPKEKDEKYLDKTVGDESSQVSKYDDGTRYPVEDKLKVSDPSLEKLKGDDAPIKECEDCEDDQDIANDNEPVNIGDSEPEENDGEEGDIAMDMGFEDQMEGGKADDAMPSNFDPEQIVMGIKIEMEHTEDPHKALEIAMDHLTEIPDYYTRLSAMEAEAKGEGSMESDSEEEMEMSSNIESEEENPEDALLDPSKHWVDDYSPSNVTDENINYPSSLSDPEVGEDDYEEIEKLKNGELDNNIEDTEV